MLLAEFFVCHVAFVACTLSKSSAVTVTFAQTFLSLSYLQKMLWITDIWVSFRSSDFPAQEGHLVAKGRNLCLFLEAFLIGELAIKTFFLFSENKQTNK